MGSKNGAEKCCFLEYLEKNYKPEQLLGKWFREGIWCYESEFDDNVNFTVSLCINLYWDVFKKDAVIYTGRPFPNAYDSCEIRHNMLLDMLTDNGSPEAPFIQGLMYEFGVYNFVAFPSMNEIKLWQNKPYADKLYELSEQRGSVMYRLYRRIIDKYTAKNSVLTWHEAVICLLATANRYAVDTEDDFYATYLCSIATVIAIIYARAGFAYCMGFLSRCLSLVAVSDNPDEHPEMAFLYTFRGDCNKMKSISYRAVKRLRYMSGNGDKAAEYTLKHFDL